MLASKFKTIQCVLLTGVIVMMTACVEKYWPELITNTDQLVVVDGGISNFPGPYTVKLSYSGSLQDTLFIPISSASIKIMDDQGNSEILTEQYPGIYKTSINGIQGIIGRSYKINIQLEDGKTYESEFEKLLNPIEVSDLIAEEEWQYAENVLEVDQKGLKFYVNTQGNSVSNAYFFWEIEETYEYHSAVNILYYYDGTIMSEGLSNNFGLKDMKDQYALYYCWKTQTLKERFNHSLENLSLEESHKLPLHFIPYGDERIRFGYNILLKQYVVSEKTYTFLNEIAKQNENQGTLFTTQPFQIRGNLFNTENQSEIVLGYFTVSSGSIGPRIQVRAPWRKYKRENCYTETLPSAIHHRITTSTAADWPIYFTDYPFEDPFEPNQFILRFAYVAQSCLDCTKHGGNTNEPSFWQEWN